MTVTARHLATVRAPLGSSERLEHLEVLCPAGGGRRLLVQRGDGEIAVRDWTVAAPGPAYRRPGLATTAP